MDADSQEILKLLYILISSLLAWNATLLWIRARTTHLFNRYLSLFVWAMLTPFALAYSMLAFPDITSILQVAVKSFILLYGPFLLLFVRVVLKEQVGNPLWHAIPFAMVLTAFTVGDPIPTGVLFALPIVGLVHAAGYTLASLNLLVKNKRQIHNLVTAYRYSAYYWLLFLIFGLLFLIAFDSYIHISASFGKVPSTTVWNGLLLLVGFYLIGVSTVSIVFSTQRPDELPTEGAQPKDNSDGQPPYPAPPESPRHLRELSESTAEILAETLGAIMRNDKVYLNSDLSMNSLGKVLGVTNHQLSELLNVHLNSSFYSYVNDFRLKEAVELLERPENNAAVADIAYQAGFNSKNSFYKIFRENYCCTPHAYRKNLRVVPTAEPAI